MFTLCVFILLVYLNVYTDSLHIEVLNSGMARLQRNDMVVVFYVTVRHFGRKPCRAMAAPVECCEKVTEDDNDCDLMDLFGGDFGIIRPGTVTNLTFLYPSLYGYNRRGYCIVKVYHRGLGPSDTVAEVSHRIDFDTRLLSDVAPHSLKGFYDPSSFIPCETPDLDPLDHCNPVDCLLKYGGYRNFYNRRARMCQRVPVCITDPDKDLPDVAYVPTSNTCFNLEKSVQEKDIQKLMKGKVKSQRNQKVNIRCHHGEIDPRSGLCICQRGWKSEPFNPDALYSGKFFYSMCTIKCKRDDPYKNLPYWVGFVLALWFLFFVSLCEWKNVFVVRRCRNSDYSFGGSISYCDSPHTIELSSTSNAVAGTKHNQCS